MVWHGMPYGMACHGMPWHSMTCHGMACHCRPLPSIAVGIAVHRRLLLSALPFIAVYCRPFADGNRRQWKGLHENTSNHPAWQDDCAARQDESSWLEPVILPHVQVCPLE